MSYVLLLSTDVDAFHEVAVRKTALKHARLRSAAVGIGAAKTWERGMEIDVVDAYVRILTVGITSSNLTCSVKCGPDREGNDEHVGLQK